MTEPVIRLDRSKPISECHGERTPEDPHYLVHFFQQYKAGKHTVLLPFDANDVLVPDDGKVAPYQALVEGKPVLHQPLYSPAMREVVAALKKRLSDAAEGKEETTTDSAPAAVDFADTKQQDDADEVNFAAWLRGEAKYQPQKLRTAAERRYSRKYGDKLYAELVPDLVLDHHVVPENQVCPAFVKFLPPKAA